MSLTEAQWRGPADCLRQRKPHGCGDQVCQHQKETSSHRLCLPALQYVSTRKKLHRRERPQTVRDDSHEEPCECATPSPEDVVGTTAI